MSDDGQRDPWGVAASGYGMHYQLDPFLNMLTAIIRAARISNQTTVLDLGGGAGLLLKRLTDLGLRPDVTIVDRSVAMLREARKVWHDGCVVLSEGDLDQPATTWGLREPTYDCIVMVNSLYLVTDPVATLKEARLLTHDPTRLVVSTPKESPNIEAILNAHLDAFVRRTGWNPEDERQRILRDFASIIQFNREQIVTNPNLHFASRQTIEAWFGEAGWRILKLGETYADQNWLIVAEDSGQDRAS